MSADLSWLDTKLEFLYGRELHARDGALQILSFSYYLSLQGCLLGTPYTTITDGWLLNAS